MWISLRLLISCAARIQHLSAARSRISCVSFSRRTGFQSLSPGLHTDHRHRPGTSENTFLEFPLVIAAVARFSRKRGLWLLVRVNHKKLPYADTHCTRTATDQVLTLPYFPSFLPAAFLSQAPAASKSPKNPPGSPFLFLPRSPGKASHRAVPRYV